MVNKIPRKWKNIRSLGIKTTQSIELPFYPSEPLIKMLSESENLKEEVQETEQNIE